MRLILGCSPLRLCFKSEWGQVGFNSMDLLYHSGRCIISYVIDGSNLLFSLHSICASDELF
ncbi:hypothetical protein BVRB_4g077250 [Beta vulgaris subsp. vulgaris]|nr:hypothetical protein BVRB_4g077250 [Beta vulgaris subsp. vulgaris]